ncbi:MAG: UbiX family flavin prenyltransferase [Anaerotardibacter sp.]
MESRKKRIVVGISGASGTPLAKHLLEVLSQVPNVEIHLIATKGAEVTCEYETDAPFSELTRYAHTVYDVTNLGEAPSSGTFTADGMIVIPCSMKTLAGIATGYSDNLLLRAADVTIKQKRPLVLVPRETPLSPIHLRNMEFLATLPEVHIVPPVFSYYLKPSTLEEMEYHIVAKILTFFDIEVPGATHWTE